jgi:hypothetical protein
VELTSRALLLAALIMLPLLIIGVLGFAMGVHPPKVVSSRTPADYGWEYETIALRTRDDVLPLVIAERRELAVALPEEAEVDQ